MTVQMGIAVAIILQREGKILIGKRSQYKDFAPGLWELPAGRMGEAESIEKTLVREMREELGIVITDQELIDAYIFNRGSDRMLLLTYTGTFEGEVVKSIEHEEIKWVTPQEAKQLFSYQLQKRTIERYQSRFDI